MRIKTPCLTAVLALSLCAAAVRGDPPWANPPVITDAISRSHTVFNAYEPPFAVSPTISEAISRAHTVFNEQMASFADAPTISEAISRAHTVFNEQMEVFADAPEITEAISRAHTVFNEQTAEFAATPEITEAVSRAHTVSNITQEGFEPTPVVTDAVSRAATYCNRAGAFVDTDSDGVHDCDDLCPNFNDALDTDGDTIPNACDRCPGLDDTQDCNTNNLPDCLDISRGWSVDVNTNNIPDECEADCNSNGNVDFDDVLVGSSTDCNSNRVPDECEIDINSTAPGGPFFCTEDCDPDCNDNAVPDTCELFGNDCNTNGVLDTCEVAAGTSRDCDGSGLPDECEGLVGTVNWAGATGGLWSEPSNWNPPGLPGSGSDTVLGNSGGGDNRAVLNIAGETTICSLALGATGSGRQALEIATGSILHTNGDVTVQSGGDILMQGGELRSDVVHNQSNTIRGFGFVTADVINAGRIEGQSGQTLTLRSLNVTNQGSGLIRAPIGSSVIFESGLVVQQGQLNVGVNATLAFSSAVTNSSGGQIILSGGGLGAVGLTNAAGGLIRGFGSIDSSVVNHGDVLTIADAQIVGDLNNEGTIVIQSGLLTVTGSLSGSGTILGGNFGGRDGESGMLIAGNFDLGVRSGGTFDLSRSTLQMAGDPSRGVQTLETLANDAGSMDAASSDSSLMWIGTLRIGPTETTVRLVDNRDNAEGHGSEVLYVHDVVLDAGVTLDLAGRSLYYHRITPADPLAETSGVRVIDSVGGGVLYRIGQGGGDFDRDGDVDDDDLRLFVDVLVGTDQTPARLDIADLNRSGAADGADIQLFVNTLLGS